MSDLKITGVHSSPNKDIRIWKPQLIVIHATGGKLAGALSWMLNPDSKVSAHWLIGKNGELYQLVEEKDVAWHAGDSEFDRVKGLNRLSIGIELENMNDGVDPYSEEQLVVCSQVCKAAMKNWQIIKIVGHSEIAPGRKTDPGKLFPWDHFLKMTLEA